MSGRILLVDNVATNRIILKVKLSDALYDVQTCDNIEEARVIIADSPPDMVLLGMGHNDIGALAFCEQLKLKTKAVTIPLIVLGRFSDTENRLAALRAGADDILVQPFDDILLLARIRSLLRARDAAAELRLRDDTSKALGFAEPSEVFAPPCHITLITDDKERSTALTGALKTIPNSYVNTLQPDVTGLDGTSEKPPVPDLVVLAVSDDLSQNPKSLFRQVANLRARPETRHAGLLVLLPDASPDLAAMLLDLGANDLVTANIGTQELVLRVNTLLRGKLLLDRLRETVRNGLQAAVTDPLTGLYNRRYAMSHLKSMAERATESGRDFAVMMLDVDHFKKINDTFGHATGDMVLQKLAARLRDNLRAVDLIARVGGEEFLVAMPDTTAQQARGAAERLRNIIGSKPFAGIHGDTNLVITLSIGVAIGDSETLRPDDLDLIYDRADKALYAAKTAGRNMVTVSQSAA